MAVELKAIVINRDDIAKLDRMLRSYTHYYVSDDIKTIVLMAEGFGVEIVGRYLNKVRYCLRRVIWQNPLIGLYLPLLSALGLRDADSLISKLNEHVDELREWVKDSRHSIERIILSERRSNLVSLALALKYFLHILDREEWRNFIHFYVNELLTDVVLAEIRKRYDDLEVIERVSLLYLYEVINSIREKLGLPLLDISSVKNYLRNLDMTRLETFTRLAIASLLYELSKLKRSKEYLLYFYEILSCTDFSILVSEIRRKEQESIEMLSIYDLDEESIKTLAIPLGDVELVLIARLISTLWKEFIHIPLIDFADFVSKYYDIPKGILKLWLSLKLIYYRILRYLGTILEFCASTFFAYITFIISSLLGNIVAITGSIIVFLGSLVVIEVLKRIQQISQSRITKYFEYLKVQATKRIEELKHRKEFFEYFVP